MSIVTKNDCFIRGMPAQVGIANSLEAALDFFDWASSLRGELTHTAIQNHYQCSRATAYRWLSAYRAVAARRAMRSAA